MNTFHDLYLQQIEVNADKSPYIVDFKGSPYSYLKARYYMFFASILVWFLQNRSVHPNTITKMYIASGFLGAFLLALPSREAHFFAIFMIFSKGILDWADGALARLKGQTSLTGHILDIYGARIHSLTFLASLGIYQYYHFERNELFLLSLFIYPFCYGTLLTKFSQQYILDGVSAENIDRLESLPQSAPSIKETHKGIYSFFTLFLDDRSRTIDFVLLLILVEHFGGPSLSWLFFLGVNVKWIALWFGSFIFSSRIEAADKVLASKLYDIKNG